MNEDNKDIARATLTGMSTLYLDARKIIETIKYTLLKILYAFIILPHHGHLQRINY